MKIIILYIKSYFDETDKRVLLTTSLFTAILIFLNYHYNIDGSISAAQSFSKSLTGRYIIFLAAFAIPYCCYALFQQKDYFRKPSFLLVLFTAPLVFSAKVGFNREFSLSADPFMNEYWNHVVYWPFLMLMVLTVVYMYWILGEKKEPFYGFKLKGVFWKPYWLMLLIMLPLIAAASTQADFQAMYPKLHIITSSTMDERLQGWHKLLFELSYGTDFISIELFFRGFLVLAFMKWAGRNAILPMACFYCTIHFGKPLGECISSYFGGLLLGIVVSNTRSIFGGLMVHLGIAWLMELGGYIGNALNH